MNITFTIPVMEAIEHHRNAWAFDDSLYLEHGVARDDIDDTAINASNEDEIAAFRIMAKAPCSTDAEVQAKLNYLFEGKAYGSASVYDSLSEDRYQDEEDQGTGNGNLFREFVQSLILSHTHAPAVQARQTGGS